MLIGVVEPAHDASVGIHGGESNSGSPLIDRGCR
jgi:hypothetical protein